MMTKGGFDAVTIGEALARPGMDTRQWISYGLVSPQQNVDGEVIDSVEFDDVDDFGPLVNVRLQPSNIEVRCRIGTPATSVAGAGEGSYAPFVENDEVLVAIPSGSEDAGCVIIARLNNSIDKWPSESIAGQDPTGNKFAFQRIRTPFIQEYASSFMVRSAAHGGFILMSDAGTITLRDGSKGSLQMGPDAFSYNEGVAGEVDPDGTPTPQAIFQYDLTGRRISLQMDDAQIQVNSSDADNNAGVVQIVSQGGTNFIPGTNQGKEHFATVEGVVNLLEKFAAVIGPLFVPPLVPPADTALVSTALNAVAAGFLPPPSTVEATLAGLITALETTPKPPVGPLGIQKLPNLGSGLVTTAG